MLSSDIDLLAERAARCLDNSGKERILIAIVGIPGSGKSTVAKKISNTINKKTHRNKTYKSLVVGMDGFHLTREELSQMKDSQQAFKRRGAPFTFDSHALVEFIKILREGCSEKTPPLLKAPSFDHELKDPVPDSIEIESDTNIIIIEGLYLMSTEEPWNKIGGLMDERWLIEVDMHTARERLAKRHVDAKVEPNLKSAFERIDKSDILNGIYVLKNLAGDVDLKVSNVTTRVEK